MRNIAVILAGGTGSRAGAGVPKQFRRLEDGRTSLEACVQAFAASRSISEIVVVMHPDHIAQAQQLLRDKAVTIIAGGSERWESSRNAIRHLATLQEEANILLHDCARPFVSQRIIDDVCRALETHEAVTMAVPMTDTLYKVESLKWKVESIPPRSEYMRAQTPQAFRLSLIERAYRLALSDPDGVAATDDCGIVNKYIPEQPIYIVEGEEANRKLTYASDFTCTL